MIRSLAEVVSRGRLPDTSDLTNQKRVLFRVNQSKDSILTCAGVSEPGSFLPGVSIRINFCDVDN